MPFFKSTYNILKKPNEDEVFNPNWMDSDKLILPPKTDWDYQREMKIEDVNIWEVIYQQGGGFGVYAAWDPYAEFYLITNHHFTIKDNAIETYYGPGSQEIVQEKMRKMGVPFVINQIWVEPEDMWLYQNPNTKSAIILVSK